MIFPGHVTCLVALLALLLMTSCPVTSQIHFSHSWGTGKRAGHGNGHSAVHGAVLGTLTYPLDDSPIESATAGRDDSCQEGEADYRIMSELVRVIRREAVTYARCQANLVSPKFPSDTNVMDDNLN
ncbi:uncharacterized protein LOC143294392 [Babylonia areolata]|uniref:uncharacterized protein LOC143294392 n=1 Tax=Babylonia areolata TaxID=304850 RepID=UPI003FD42D84